MQEYVENRKCSQRHAVPMTRQRFLDLLQEKWINDNLLTVPATVEDLLDDASALGLRGASDAYFGYLLGSAENLPVKEKKGVKLGVKRGSYKRR